MAGTGRSCRALAGGSRPGTAREPALAVQDAGRGRRGRQAALADAGAERWIAYGKVAYDAATDGCFPLVSNDRELSDAELLGAYRYQPNLQKRHHQLKSVLATAPVELKSPSRIEGLACCEFVALLCQCLIERELRAAMTRHGISELALYHEARASKAPTAARVFHLFAETARHHHRLLTGPLTARKMGEISAARSAERESWRPNGSNSDGDSGRRVVGLGPVEQPRSRALGPCERVRPARG